MGAIALGGGLAYGYKTFLGAPSGGKAPPMIKADKSPAKTQPTDPGGKQFTGQTMKVMNGRLTDGSDSTAQSSSTNEDGVRSVKTLAITPPGSAPQQPPAASGPPGAVAMPGVYVIDPLRRAPPQPSPQQQALMAQQPQLAPPAPSPQAPRTITLPPPSRVEAPPPPAAPVTPVAKAPPRVAAATTAPAAGSTAAPGC